MAKPYGKSLIIASAGLILWSSATFARDVLAQRTIPLPPPPPIVWPDERPADPARWTQEDVTQEQKYETARKESLAAHQIAQDYCKSLPKIDQALCLAQTRLEFEKELSDIKTKFGIQP